MFCYDSNGKLIFILHVTVNLGSLIRMDKLRVEVNSLGMFNLNVVNSKFHLIPIFGQIVATKLSGLCHSKT